MSLRRLREVDIQESILAWAFGLGFELESGGQPASIVGSLLSVRARGVTDDVTLRKVGTDAAEHTLLR
jgi:hypothetical protein